MPIQPLNVSRYNAIPDVEDVSPVHGSIAKKEKRIYKIIAILLGGVVIYGALRLVGVKIPTPFSSYGAKVLVYQTSMFEGDRLRMLNTREMQGRGFKVGSSLDFGNVKYTAEELTSPPTSAPSVLTIDSKKTFQDVIGFGGAFTEAAAVNFFKLPQDVQKKVIDLYFGEDGIGYSVGRVHINSCDFSLKSYSFDDIAGDYALQYFDTEVTHDNAQMLPLIRMAMGAAKAAGKTRGNSPTVAEHGINLLVSPWSPPSWMKRALHGHQNMTGSAEPHGLIDTDQMKKAWALYIVKFIIAYEAKGAPVWALTPQNEPEFAAPWEACAYNATYERDFINGYLGPTLKQYRPDVKLLAFDHNKDHLLDWTKTMLGSKEDKWTHGDYVDGMAFHWYAEDSFLPLSTLPFLFSFLSFPSFLFLSNLF
jgi:O-glycosyl hydrolase